MVVPGCGPARETGTRVGASVAGGATGTDVRVGGGVACKEVGVGLAAGAHEPRIIAPTNKIQAVRFIFSLLRRRIITPRRNISTWLCDSRGQSSETNCSAEQRVTIQGRRRRESRE